MRFHIPTKIIFGSGMITQLKEIIDNEFGTSRLFLVTDKGIRDAGIADRICSQFHKIAVFDGVEQNPKHHTVDKGGEIARKINPDLIIGLGGGSALDAAKAIALLVKNRGKIEDYEGKKKYGIPPLPVLAIPTTCGTGSEVTWVSVITHARRKFKMSIKGPEMFPAVAFVDPDLLSTLPSSLVASTGMDALTHAVEAYSVKPANPITDLFAREAVRLILFSLEQAYKDIRQNKEAREKLMMGSMLAGIAFGNSDVGAVHCLAEAMGSLFDIPHGLANSVFLPYIMEFNLPVSVQKYGELARISGIQDRNSRSASLKFIQKIKDISKDLNIPCFKDLGIGENHFAEIAQKSFENNSNPSNPRAMAVKDYENILKRTLAGE